METITNHRVNKSDIEQYYGYSIHEAALRLDLPLNELKMLCRSFGIPRWPNKRKKMEESCMFKSFSVQMTSFKSNPTKKFELQTATISKKIKHQNDQKVLSMMNKETLNVQKMSEIKPTSCSRISITNICNKL